MFLNVSISQVVDRNSKEAEVIVQYVKNTHAATHNTYTLEVQEVSETVNLYLKHSTTGQLPGAPRLNPLVF